jgi:hypothetical protein
MLNDENDRGDWGEDLRKSKYAKMFLWLEVKWESQGTYAQVKMGI